MLVFATLLLFVQSALFVSADGKVATEVASYTGSVTTTYSTQYNVVKYFFGLFQRTDTTFYVHTPTAAAHTTTAKVPVISTIPATTTVYEDYNGDSTITASYKTVPTSDVYGNVVDSVTVYVQTPRPSGVISYQGYTGSTTEYYSTTVSYSFGFKDLVLGLWPVTTYLVNTPYSVAYSDVTIPAHVSSLYTAETTTFTSVGTDGISTTSTVYTVLSPIVNLATTKYSQGTQTGVTETLTNTDVITGTDKIVTSVTVYNVVVPTHLSHTTSFDYWPATYATTYETDYTTITGTDGSATAKTVFYVHTPRNPGETSYIPYTGTSTIFYSTIVNTVYTSTHGIINSWEHTTYLVKSPIHETTITDYVPVYQTSEDNITETTSVYVTGKDGEITTNYIYLVGVLVRETVITTYVQGTQTNDESLVVGVTDFYSQGTDGFETSVTLYTIAVPTHYEKLTSYVDGGSSINTFSTEYTTLTGSDGAETATTVFYVETPRHPGVTSFTAANVTSTEFFSTSVEYSLGFKDLIFGLWTVTHYYAYTPIIATSSTVYMDAQITATKTLFDEVSTITGTDGKTTTLTVFFVATPVYIATTTLYSQGTQTGSSVTYSTSIEATVGTNGESSTITSFYVAVPTHLQKTTSYTQGTDTVAKTISTEYFTNTGSDNIETATTLYLVENARPTNVVSYLPWTGTYTSTSTDLEFHLGFNDLFLFGLWPTNNIYVYTPTPLSTSAATSTAAPTVLPTKTATATSVPVSVTDSTVSGTSFDVTYSGATSILSGYPSYNNGTESTL